MPLRRRPTPLPDLVLVAKPRCRPEGRRVMRRQR
jgi:hypothetical protein